jgi:hypothetical protein
VRKGAVHSTQNAHGKLYSVLVSFLEHGKENEESVLIVADSKDEAPFTEYLADDSRVLVRKPYNKILLHLTKSLLYYSTSTLLYTLLY